ncbi:hypothetical protein GSY69_02730 [Brevibacterium sp. 5221]|uniref:5'-3' exonuclease n=1 Tax=Brevibacterium rongguiense TaxID=2695267 RepID=A0A6N9H5H6_9MICO|nr:MULTISPECIES: exonuclease domain-containing protein [Brevibacterium]MYM18922.1 hypothetical protein [Brevibacterium rongguiense]WAL40770.1 exonuclease domain-containing protein [Brevibacterium sp. BRM-1]
MREALLVLDTPALYYRAFYALPTSLRDAAGTPVNAVRGLLDTVAALCAELPRPRVIAAFDADWRPAFRTALVPEYKAQRVRDEAAGTETPEELAPQLPIIRRALTAAGIPIAEVPGTEADDVIASLAAQVPGPVTIVSPDRDLLALLDGERVVLRRPRPKGEWEVTAAADLPALYGVAGPELYRELAALRGDPSDGLAGAPGIGEKTAARLLAAHGSLDGVFAAARAGSADGGLTPKRRAALLESEEAVRANAAVMACLEDLPVGDWLAAADHVPERLDRAALAELGRAHSVVAAADRLSAALGGWSAAGREHGARGGAAAGAGASSDVEGPGSGAAPSPAAGLPAAPEDGVAGGAPGGPGHATADGSPGSAAAAGTVGRGKTDTAAADGTTDSAAAGSAGTGTVGVPAAGTTDGAAAGSAGTETGGVSAASTAEVDAASPVGAGTAGEPAPGTAEAGAADIGTAGTGRGGAAANEAEDGTEPGWPAGPVWGFDLETTGVDPRTARIVTAALVEFDRGARREAYTWLADPGVEIPAAAAAVHGISTERARTEGMDRRAVVEQLCAAIADITAAGGVLAGHNIAYDLTVLQAECERLGISPAVREVHPPIVDTLVLDRRAEKYRRGPRILQALAERWGVELVDAHSADADAAAAAAIALAIGAASAEIGGLSPAAVHAAQIAWKAEQAADLEAYLRAKRDPQARVSRAWPFEE